MEDAFSNPQSVLLIGGTSEIGLATLREFVSPTLKTVVVAARDVESAKASAIVIAPNADVRGVFFDAVTCVPENLISDCIQVGSDVDVVILAAGMLGYQAADEASPARAAQVQHVNATIPMEIAHGLTLQLMAQGHGTLVVLSSIAAVRARRDNFVYGASKAALDAFCQGLSLLATGSGARVVIVRPGFVATKMTEGMSAAPFATTAAAVAADIKKALSHGKSGIVYSPPILRGVALGLANAPNSVVRRMKG